MDRITDKLGWEEMVFNQEITKKWRAELVKFDEDGDKNETKDETKEADSEDVNELKEVRVDEGESRQVTNEMVDWVSFI